MENIKVRALLPVAVFFIALNAFFIVGRNSLEKWGMDQEVIIYGNLILLFITVLSLWMAQKGLRNPNPHAFVRWVYASMLLKLLLCMVVVFLYVFLNQKNYNKPALFTCMGLYLVYSFLEVSGLMKMVKGKRNG